MENPTEFLCCVAARSRSAGDAGRAGACRGAPPAPVGWEVLHKRVSLGGAAGADGRGEEVRRDLGAHLVRVLLRARAGGRAGVGSWAGGGARGREGSAAGAGIRGLVLRARLHEAREDGHHLAELPLTVQDLRLEAELSERVLAPASLEKG